MLARSFLIESSSKLLVTRTGIKAWSSLILDRIRPLILELHSLEWQKFHTCELENLWSQLANLDQILCVAWLGWGKGCIRFWGRLDQNSGFHGNRKPPLTYNGENDVSTFSRLLAHLSRRLTGWAYRMGLEPASVCPCVRASTLSNMNISETSRPITTKFYLKHHWDGGKAVLGFDADQIRTLVSMAMDSSYRVIMGKRASSRFLDCFWSDPFYTCR